MSVEKSPVNRHLAAEKASETQDHTDEEADIAAEPEVPEDLEQIRREVPDEQFSDEYGEQSGREFVEAEMESPEAEGLDGSLTNELVETQAGTVLKEFSSRPAMAYVQMLGRIPSMTLEYQDQESRIENEEAFRQYTEDLDVEVPEILGVQDNYVEFEKIDGTDMNTYLNQASGEEAYEAGTLVGGFLDEIHAQDGAFTDLRINNFMMQEEGLGFVDGEYFSDDASSWEKKMDMITMISSAKQVDSQAYESFREGFEDEYGGEIDIYEDVISSVTAPGHAKILERDQERFENASANVRNNIKSYAPEIF